MHPANYLPGIESVRELGLNKGLGCNARERIFVVVSLSPTAFDQLPELLKHFHFVNITFDCPVRPCYFSASLCRVERERSSPTFKPFRGWCWLHVRPDPSGSLRARYPAIQSILFQIS